MRAAVALFVSALVLAVWTMALAEPRVTIYTDKSSYQSGDTVGVTLGVTNPGDPTTVNLCFGLVTFWGGIYTLGPSDWVEDIVPWAVELRIPSGINITAQFYFEVPSVLPAPPIHLEGEYYFASVGFNPGTSDWATNIALAPFSYTVSGPISLVSIPAGSFLMGSPPDELWRESDEGPQRTVNISAFHISQTEITQKQWQDVMGWNNSHFSGGAHPVEYVTWFDCISFCNKLSDAQGLTRCYTISNIGYDDWGHITSADVTCDFDANGYRLPTEAEWEYACRAGTTTCFYTGDSDSDLDSAGWYYSNSGFKTRMVAKKEPNAWDLYDMHGNVWEWCWDWYDEDYYGTRPDPDSDPRGPSSGSDRVARGGGWYHEAQDCRSASRYRCAPGYKYYDGGFRIARSGD